jgi:hypothetical protein
LIQSEIDEQLGTMEYLAVSWRERMRILRFGWHSKLERSKYHETNFVRIYSRAAHSRVLCLTRR